MYAHAVVSMHIPGLKEDPCKWTGKLVNLMKASTRKELQGAHMSAMCDFTIIWLFEPVGCQLVFLLCLISACFCYAQDIQESSTNPSVFGSRFPPVSTGVNFNQENFLYTKRIIKRKNENVATKIGYLPSR